jgi:hypothetical protein
MSTMGERPNLIVERDKEKAASKTAFSNPR